MEEIGVTEDIIPADKVEIIGIKEVDLWALFKSKGVSRACKECSLSPDCDLLIRTTDTKEGAITVELSMISIDFETHMYTHNTIAIACPNCGFVRSFSASRLLND